MLLLDMGNSRLKWRFPGLDPACGGALDWMTPDLADQLRERWSALIPPSRILAASVTSGDRRERLQILLNELDWPAPEYLCSPSRRGGLVNAYGRPSDLGIDRFLAMLAAVDDGLAPCVIASCGTALTLDAVDGQGRHLGGQIIPGTQAMLVALQTVAPGLPDASQGQAVAFAHSTVDAMQSGAWNAGAAAIERFAGQAAIRLDCNPHLLLCGGYAIRMAELLDRPCQHFDQAVLRGLEVWARQDGGAEKDSVAHSASGDIE